MKTIMMKYLFWLGFILLIGCRPDSSRLDIDECCRQHGINLYAYFYAENDKVVKEGENLDGAFSLGEQWVNKLCVPLAFQQAMKDGEIDESMSLNKIITVRTLHEKMIPENLFRIKEDSPSLFYWNGNEAQQYMTRMLRRISTDKLQQFKEKKLGMEIPDKWYIKNLLRETARISTFMEQNHVTGFRPVGSGIPDLYPTWFVENTHQLAGWYTFRINEHVVLWNSLSDGEKIIFCLKFVDLGKTLAIVAPYMESMQTFDEEGRPDLLLSPFVTTILKKVFLPSEQEINYKESQEQLCRIFRSKLHSPYLSLYIKELSTQIRLSKKNNRGLYNKLAHVYSTVFPCSLPLSYIDKTPVAAINYVSNATRALRLFSLTQESRLSVFYSEQRLLYRTKSDKEGKNKHSIAVDSCWIENRQDSSIVWQSSKALECPMTLVRVERDEVTLPAGEYVVHYESDEKHSFEKWFSYPPQIDDYGIRVYKEI